MFFAWNFRRQTTGANEPYLTDWKNDSQQSDEIKANWNQATDTKKQCKTHFMAMKEHAIQSRHNSSGEVGRKTLAYVFLSRFPLLF